MRNQSKQSYKKHDIQRQYDSQNGYRGQESYYGDGRYPPDWDGRREAVWERQNYQCGRCGVYKGDVSVSEVHHIKHLSNEGSNSLDNLVGLCGNCHALMHPDNEKLRGNPWQADLFPDTDANRRVAVIREPNDNDDLETDLQRLSEFSSPDTNNKAVTSATIPTDAKLATQAGNNLPSILINNGFVPRISSYHRVSVEPTPTGLLSAISPREITINVTDDGQTREIEEHGNSIDIYHTADTKETEIEVTDSVDKKRSHQLELAHADGERLSVRSPISAPPLSVGTLPEYTLGAIQYFGWKSLKTGLIPGLIVAFVFPSLVPGNGSLVGTLGIMLLVGLLIRSWSIYQDITGTATEEIIHDRES